jgi:hypothetical protein
MALAIIATNFEDGPLSRNNPHKTHKRPDTISSIDEAL